LARGASLGFHQVLGGETFGAVPGGRLERPLQSQGFRRGLRKSQGRQYHGNQKTHGVSSNGSIGSSSVVG
jgi:hypothetical protein